MAERDSAMQRILWSVICVAVATLATLALSAAAHADTPITAFSIAPSSTQAGGHPDIKAIVDVEDTNLQYPNNQTPPGDCRCHDAKNIIIDGPAGAIPNTSAGVQCSGADFGENRCPIDSQVGVVNLNLSGEVGGTKSTFVPIPVYNLVPRPGQAGLAGFFAPFLASPVFTVVEGRTESDYGLEFAVTGITHFSSASPVRTDLLGSPRRPHSRCRTNAPQGVPALRKLGQPVRGRNPLKSPVGTLHQRPPCAGLGWTSGSRSNPTTWE